MAQSARGVRLQAMNRAREAQYILEIKRALKHLRRKELKFEKLGVLIAMVSAISRIHRVTLNRNPKYRALIWVFYVMQSGLLEEVSDDAAPVELLRQKLVLARAEIAKLKKQVASLAEDKAHSEGSVVTSGQSDDSRRGIVAFDDTATVLALVLERVGGTIVLDMKNERIEDLAARPSDRTIAENPRTRAFCNWLRTNSKFLHAAQIPDVHC